MTKLTDEALWKHCIKGDRSAFEGLYKRYYPLLYNYGCKFSSNKDIVRDCIQNFFVKLIQNSPMLTETSHVKGYVLKAFRNQLYDSLKHENKRNDTFPCMDDVFGTEEEQPSLSEEKELPIEQVIMRLAFMELSPRQREILYLYYIMGISHTEISSILNINYQSSKNLVFRSLIKLKEEFFRKKEALNTTIRQEDTQYSHISEISIDFNWLEYPIVK